MNLSVEKGDKPIKFFRDKIISELKENYVHDNLEDHEFEKRLEIATNTQSKNELLSLISDLPEMMGVETSEKKQKEIEYSGNRENNENVGMMISIFSGSDRAGAWNPPKRLNVINIFGGSKIDLREACLAPNETKISIMCIFGGVDIVVPPGVNVISNGISIFGGIGNKSSGEMRPNTPTVIVNGFVLFGGMDIKVKTIKKKKSLK